MQELPVPNQLVPRKVPLSEAAVFLEDICDRIDNGVPLDQALTTSFHEARLDLAEAVDRRIAFDIWIKGRIRDAKEARDEFAAKAKQLELLHEKFKENTQIIVEAHPDLPYQGKYGKIALQKNPPALHLAIPDKELTPDMVEAFGIADEYVKVKVSYVLDSAKVKADIAAGKHLPWAKIEQGMHVRFRK